LRADQLKFIEEMNKKFGKNALRLASDIAAERAIRISSGSLSLDIALGGGLPLGRFIQMSGAFSSCKSSLVYHAMRNFQNTTKQLFERVLVKKADKKKDKDARDIYEYIPVDDEWVRMTAMLIQSESESWTNDYGAQIGIDVEALLFNQCAGMEEATEIAHQAQESAVADLIVFDSLEALVPMKEYDSGMDETVQMGLKPKLFGEYFRKYQATNNRLSREGLLPITVIGINQLREKIGAQGDPEYTPGGRAKDFAASIDLRLRRGDWIVIGSGQNKQIIGQQVRFKVHKNKTGTPQRTGMFDFYFDEGGASPIGHIDTAKEVMIEGIAYGIIKKGGAWFSYGELKAQGEDKFIDLLRTHIEHEPEIYTELYQSVMNVAMGVDSDLEDRFGEENGEELFEEDEA
jgi:recombination protein RecA